MEVLRNADLPVSRWPNGAGRKADLAAGDGWMAGFAWLDAHAPFSLLTGLDRTITLVEGPGFTLHVEGRPLPVLARFTPTPFDGGSATHCRIAGACRVLNVMTDRTRYRHRVAIIGHSGPIDPAGSVACLAVVLEGRARIGDDTLAPLDAVKLDEPADLLLKPDSRAAVITIGARAAA